MMYAVRIRRQGHSYGITVPRAFLAAAQWLPGQILYAEMLAPGTVRLSAFPPRPRPGGRRARSEQEE